MITLHLLVIAAQPFARPMADHLLKYGSFLRPPTIIWTGPERYNNPHAPILQTQDMAARHQAMMQGVQNGNMSPNNVWRNNCTQGMPQQAEETKREQIEQVFAQMSSGMDLENVEPGWFALCVGLRGV
jgi:hypothetical protein